MSSMSCLGRWRFTRLESSDDRYLNYKLKIYKKLSVLYSFLILCIYLISFTRCECCASCLGVSTPKLSFQLMFSWPFIPLAHPHLSETTIWPLVQLFLPDAFFWCFWLLFQLLSSCFAVLACSYWVPLWSRLECWLIVSTMALLPWCVFFENCPPFAPPGAAWIPNRT